MFLESTRTINSYNHPTNVLRLELFDSVLCLTRTQKGSWGARMCQYLTSSMHPYLTWCCQDIIDYNRTPKLIKIIILNVE